MKLLVKAKKHEVTNTHFHIALAQLSGPSTIAWTTANGSSL